MFVDYNYEHIDEKTGKPTGTLRIPAFLKHCDRYVDSRSILKRSCEYVKEELMKLLQANQVKGMEFIDANEIADVIFTSATELEFWVKTPSRNVVCKSVIRISKTTRAILATYSWFRAYSFRKSSILIG